MFQTLLFVSFISTVLLGAVYMAFGFKRIDRSLGLGALLGSVMGGLGPLILMLPLNFCTFERERERLDVIFGLLLFAVGAWFALAFSKWLVGIIFDKATRARLAAEQNSTGTFKSNLMTPLLLLAPTLVILAVFLYYPLLETFRLSTLLARLGAPRTRFQCVSNFTALLSPDYGEVLFNTFFIATNIVVVGLILGLAIAMLAFQPVRGAQIYRTLLIWPYAISPAIAGIIFFVMFDPVAGIVNHFIELMGGQGLEWIRDPWLARLAVIITSIWKTLGYNVLFYIAGLQTISPNLLEAAAIDGANAWQRFLNIIVPGLSPITFFLIVTNITYAFFSIFGTIDYLTRGGPAGATSVSIYEIYQLGIRSKDLGRAAAQSLVLFLLVVLVTVLQFRTSGRRVSYDS